MAPTGPDASDPFLDPVEQLLFDAVEAADGDWDRAVRELCERYPDRAESIRRRVAVLADLDLGLPADSAADDAATAGAAPARLGEYRLLRELGAGGMGVVYLAEHEPLGRTVALKVLPPQATYDARFLERFRREAQAAARLHHPHIVPVYGVGESDGVHYYAMQFVDGCGLDRILDEAQRLGREDPAGQPENAPPSRAAATALAAAVTATRPDRHPSDSPSGTASTSSSGSDSNGSAMRLRAVPSDLSQKGEYARAVARIGLHVAEALAYAHAHGILHRDVKPSNLLLDTNGNVWVTDFGLCKAEGTADLTHSGDVVGTLRYLAPERFAGADDVRSEVYALGITLYELLTVRPAFGHTSRPELLRQILERDPVRPRRIDPTIPRDLEAIVVKAIQKDPKDRYASADELARDLACHLGDRPVAARPPSFAHYVKLAVQRNRPLAATIVLAFVGLVVAAAVYTIDLTRARDDARRQSQLATERAAQADRVTEFLVDLFDQARPGRSLGDALPVGLVLQRGTQQIRDELADQPAVRARLLASLGRAHQGLGSYEKAEALLADAVGTAEREGEVSLESRLRWQIMLSEVWLLRSRFADAERQLLATLATVRRELGPDHVTAAACTDVLARVSWRAGRHDEAERRFTDAIGIYRANVDGDDRWLASCLTNIAGFLHDTGRDERSQELFAEALAMEERLYPGGHPSIVVTLSNRVRPLVALGRYDEAERSIERARREAERIFGAQHPDVASVLLQHAHFLTRRGRDREAEPLLRRAIAIDEELLGPDSPVVAMARNDLGTLLGRTGEWAAALETLERAHSIAENAYAERDHLHRAINASNLAEALAMTGATERAEILARQSLAMRRRLEPSGGEQVALGLRTLAWIQLTQNRIDDAVHALEQAIAECERGGVDGLTKGDVLRVLCHAHNRGGQGSAAESVGTEALAVLRATGRAEHPDTALLLYNLGWACTLQGDADRAEPFFRQSIAMYRAVAPDGCAELAYPLSHLGSILGRTRPAEAVPLLEAAVEIRRKFLPEGSPWIAQNLQALAAAHFELGEFAAAEPLYREALDSFRRAYGEDAPATRQVREQLATLRERWQPKDGREAKPAKDGGDKQ